MSISISGLIAPGALLLVGLCIAWAIAHEVRRYRAAAAKGVCRDCQQPLAPHEKRICDDCYESQFW